MTFQEKHFARMLSFSVTIGLYGAIYGGRRLDYLRNTIGYKPTVEVLISIGIILACITYLIIPKTSDQNKSVIFADLKTVFTNSKVLAVCFFTGLVVGPLEGFADV